MSVVVIYKSKYGSTKAYAEWIAEDLGCEAVEARNIKPAELAKYDAIVYGGGLYAEVISGVGLITKQIDTLSAQKIAIFTTGLTPPDCRDYYDKLVIEKNFPERLPENVRIFNYPGKMVLEELSVPHKMAIKALKKIMSGKENPTEMEQLLISLCDASGDFTDKTLITELVEYIR